MERPVKKRSSVAWFKLAEFIDRGERERALSIYKLLSHTITDKAFVAQLRGDILRSFGDAEASQAYEEAARVYKGARKIVQAASLYECMNDGSVPMTYDRAFAALRLYEQLGWSDKAFSCARDIVDLFIKEERFSAVHDVLRTTRLESWQRASLHERFVVRVLGTHGYTDKPLIQSHILAALEAYAACDEGDTQISHFLSKIAPLSDQAHEFALHSFSFSEGGKT